MSDASDQPATPGPRRRSLGDALLSLLSRVRAPSLGVGELGSLLGEARIVSPRQLILAVIFGGLCGTGVLVVLNAEGRLVEHGDYSLSFAVLFVLLIIGYRFAQKLTMITTSESVERALDQIRRRVAGKLTRLNLRDYEAMPREEIYAGLARHYETISESTVQLVAAAQALVLLLLIIIYMLIISAAAFAMWAVVTLLVILIYQGKARERQTAMVSAVGAEGALLGNVEDVLQGFRELKLDVGKRDDLVSRIARHSGEASDLRIRAGALFIDVLVFSNSIYYLLAGALVFLLPVIDGASHEVVFQIVTIVTFLLGPLGSVVSSLQILAKARFALSSVVAFEERLDKLGEPAQPPVVTPAFHELAMQGVTYQHREAADGRAFSVGPLNLTLNAGEIVFLTGGNGSGKSTALKLLLALYAPVSGTLTLNGAAVAGGQVGAYRGLFGAVFAESHVFRQLHGLSGERVAVLRELLQELEIADKVSADSAHGIEPNMLSTGQRKRLALAIVLAEDRPILVLDEWAADQDPEHRAAFYRRVLPRLKAQGKTVFAVTHDDRYFDAADRRYHMEEGRMTEVTGA